MKQLWRCDEESKELARSLVREAVEKMQAEFKERDEEMDHKFNLQVAENKRLQGHIGELKKENKHLCRTRVPRGPAAAAPPRASDEAPSLGGRSTRNRRRASMDVASHSCVPGTRRSSRSSPA